MTDEDRERRTIRDAMDRLLAGAPLASSGKLTVSALADEAGLKRWRLTHKHPDLQDEFRARIRAQGMTPTALRELQEKNAQLREQHERNRQALRQANADLKRMAGVVQVLARENAELEERVRGGAPNVTSIHRHPLGSRS